MRLARRHGATEPGSTEIEWLPKLAPLLPCEIPVPVARGRPAEGYPWFWEIHTWVEGENVPVEELDGVEAARRAATGRFAAGLRRSRSSGVIDWGAMGVGDPACDVMVAWKLHSHAARGAFRDALPTDDATWARARGWALSQAVAALAYYTPANNPALFHEADSWLDLVMSE